MFKSNVFKPLKFQYLMTVNFIITDISPYMNLLQNI